MTAGRFTGSNPDRQSVGDPGHCERCAEVGHVSAHPDLGCGDVGCYQAHGPTQADPDRPCPHEDFQVLADVARITATDGGPVVAFKAELTVNCANCGERFRWMGGLPVGDLAGRPTVDLTGFQLRAPICPSSADPDFGLGLGGFTVRRRSVDDPQ